MNACDDQTEPLGEAPAIDTLGAIGRAGVLGLLSAADKITATKELAERQGQALNEIRELAEYWRDEVGRPPHPPARKLAGRSILAILDRLAV